MGRNVSEGGRSMSGVAEDDGRCRSATDDVRRRRVWRKRVEAFGRLQKMAVRRTTIAFLAGGRRSCISPHLETDEPVLLAHVWPIYFTAIQISIQFYMCIMSQTTYWGRGIPSLLRSTPMVPTPHPCNGSSATFSKTACMAISSGEGLQELETLSLLFSL